MEFKVIERMMLLNLLGDAEGDVTTLRVIRDTQEKVGFTEEELAVLNIRQDGTQVKWEGSADKPVEIAIGRAAHNVISAKLERLNTEKKLTIPQLNLYDKFNPPEVEEEEPGGPHAIQEVPKAPGDGAQAGEEVPSA